MDLSLIWKAYRAASRIGTNHGDLAKALGIDQEAFSELFDTIPAIQEAIEAGAQSTTPTVVSLLSSEMKQQWRDLVSPDNVEPHQQALMVLANGGEQMKKRMFAVACVESNFAISKVMRTLGITKKMYERWVSDDPEFLELVQEINFQKKNLAEQALFSLVVAGSEKTVLFVNERLNRSEYGNEVKVTGEIAHTHGTLDLAALDLPLELQTAILNHLQTKGMVDSDGLLIGQ